MAEKNLDGDAVKDRVRSPGYPTIALDEAIAKAGVFHKADKGAAATPDVLAHHWKSKTTSSAFLQWLPSLKRFGLLEELPGVPRRLKLTKLALDILMLEEGDPRRMAAIKQAAVMPRPFLELWTQHGLNLPSDQNLHHHLVTSRNFRPDAAADLVRQYKRTIEFAKLEEGDKITEDAEPIQRPSGSSDPFNALFGPKHPNERLVRIDDFVQWESNGQLQFTHPRKVTGRSEDGAWIFVEGSPTGLPVNEVRRVDPPDQKVTPMNRQSVVTQASSPPPNPNFVPMGQTGHQVVRAVEPKVGTKRETFVLDSGEVVVQWPEMISPEDYADIEGWIDILKRKIKRGVNPNLKSDGPAKIEMNPQ